MLPILSEQGVRASGCAGGYAQDVFSLGVTLHALLTGETPFCRFRSSFYESSSMLRRAYRHFLLHVLTEAPLPSLWSSSSSPVVGVPDLALPMLDLATRGAPPAVATLLRGMTALDPRARLDMTTARDAWHVAWNDGHIGP